MARTFLNGAMTATDTSATVVNGAVLPSINVFTVRIENEEIRCLSRSTNTLTVSRAWNGTTAEAHGDGEDVILIGDPSLQESHNIPEVESAPVAAHDTVAISSSYMAGFLSDPSDILDNTAGGTDALLTKAPTSNAFYDFAIQKGAASGLATLSAGSVVVEAAVKSKMIQISRDLATASGDVAYTGVGFKPTALVAIGSLDSSLIASWGMSDSSKGAFATLLITTALYSQTVAFLIYLGTTVAAHFQTAIVKSYDADGFTLTWAKTGTPTGVSYINVMALR